MHHLSAWFTRNPVAANLLMILILIAGYFTVTSIRIEGFPAIPPSSVSILTVYPGASASQVDANISRRVELALEGMPGIKKIFSSSHEGVSNVHVQKVSRFDLDRFQNEIKTRVDSIYNLPKDAERPVITRDEFSVTALLVQVYGDTDAFALQKTARFVKNSLLASPSIAKINLFGLLPYEIRIEADESKLKAHQLTLPDITRVINSNSFDYKQGTLKSDSGRIVIKADSRSMNKDEFEQIPVKTKPDGTIIRMKDVARIVDGFEDVEWFARFQGKPSVGMLVYTTQKGDLIEVSKAAHKVVNGLKGQLPENIFIDVWGESSIYMKARLDLLKENALQGLFIVFVMLALFLNIRLAFWVAMGIPISIGGAMALMGPRFLDYSLNDVTTFGLIIVLGLLVDDAVVVGESVFEQRKFHSDPSQGTISGVKKVSTATVFGCFTTVAAFYPSLLIDNDLGKIFASFSTVVIVCLLVSLIESKLILPAHLAHISMDNGRSKHLVPRYWNTLQNAAASTLEFINQKLYMPFLKTALKHRYTYLLVFTSLSVLIIGMMFKGYIRSVFFPEVPGQIIIVNMDMINGSPVNLTTENLNRIEKAADELNEEVMRETRTDQPPILKLLSALTGEESMEMYAELQPEKTRQIETLETLRRWREKVQDLEGVRKLTFSGSFETAGGFEIEIHHPESDLLTPVTEELLKRINGIKGVQYAHSDLNAGMPQIRLRLKPRARHLGLTASDLAAHIGNAFGGLEVQRFLRQTDEVKVIVKYQNQKHRYISDLMETRIQTPAGDLVPLPMIATLETGHAPSGIYRKNGVRVTSVEADLDKNIISPEALFKTIKNEFEPDLAARYPGFGIKGAGDVEEMGEMKGGLKKAFIMILIGIYTLLAIPLKSYLQPFVIMSVIPFCFVGAAVGHKLMGFPLSVLSFLGILGASGVVVNDSLVMMTRYNELLEEKRNVVEALVLAGSSRFRAIFLTTATTVCGLTPLMFEKSEQAQYLIPAAVSLAFGELLATPVTLVLIPILLSAGQDLKQIFSLSLFKKSTTVTKKHLLTDAD